MSGVGSPDTKRLGRSPSARLWRPALRAGAGYTVVLLVSFFALAVAVDTSGVASAVWWIVLIVVLFLGIRALYVEARKRHDLAVLRRFDTAIESSSEDRLSALLRRHDEIHRSLRLRVFRTALATVLVHGSVHAEDWAAANRAASHLPSLDRVIVRPCLAGPTMRRLPLATRLSAKRRWLRPVIPSSAKRAYLALGAAQCVSYHKGDFARSLLLGRQIWQVRKQPSIAWNCACACAHIGDPDSGVRWVLRAVKHGYPAKEIDTDPDLASIRDDPRLAKLRPRPAAQAATPTVSGLDFGPYLA